MTHKIGMVVTTASKAVKPVATDNRITADTASSKRGMIGRRGCIASSTEKRAPAGAARADVTRKKKPGSDKSQHYGPKGNAGRKINVRYGKAYEKRRP